MSQERGDRVRKGRRGTAEPFAVVSRMLPDVPTVNASCMGMADSRRSCGGFPQCAPQIKGLSLSLGLGILLLSMDKTSW